MMGISDNYQEGLVRLYGKRPAFCIYCLEWFASEQCFRILERSGALGGKVKAKSMGAEDGWLRRSEALEYFYKLVAKRLERKPKQWRLLEGNESLKEESGRMHLHICGEDQQEYLSLEMILV